MVILHRGRDSRIYMRISYSWKRLEEQLGGGGGKEGGIGVGVHESADCPGFEDSAEDAHDNLGERRVGGSTPAGGPVEGLIRS